MLSLLRYKYVSASHGALLVLFVGLAVGREEVSLFIVSKGMVCSLIAGFRLRYSCNLLFVLVPHLQADADCRCIVQINNDGMMGLIMLATENSS